MYNLWYEIGMFEIEEQNLALHAKFAAFSRTRDLQKLRFNSCEKRLRTMK